MPNPSPIEQDLIAINTQGMSFEEGLLFATNMSHMFGIRGRPKRVNEILRITPMFGLKLLLGIPPDQLSPDNQRIAELVYIETYGPSSAAKEDIWGKPQWSHANPKAQPVRKYPVLDIEYLQSFGFSMKCWEDEVFVSNGIVERSKQDILTESEHFRARVMLRWFGFPQSEHFFREK